MALLPLWEAEALAALGEVRMLPLGSLKCTAVSRRVRLGLRATLMLTAFEFLFLQHAVDGVDFGGSK